jgi:hypothetical protein
MEAAIAIVAVITAVISLLTWGRFSVRRERAAKRAGTFARDFVLVEDDGTARELTREEIEYLNTEFHPADGARPYIKTRYGSRTPDGLIGGFLLRRRLPGRISPRRVT